MQEEQLFGVPHGVVTALSVEVHHDDELGTWVTVGVHWKNRKMSMITISPPDDVHIGDVLMPWHGVQASVYKLRGAMAGLHITRCVAAMDRLGCEVRTSGSRLPA